MQNIQKLSDEERRGLLAEACGGGRTDVVNQLIGNNLVDANATVLWTENPRGKENEPTNEPTVRMTPLHIACIEGQVDCVRALLRAGVRVDIADENKRLPYVVAKEEVKKVFKQELLQQVASGNVEAVKALLRGEVPADATDGTSGDSSALHWAASFGQSKEMVKLLVDSGARLDRRNSKGQTALHEACESGQLESARVLVELGSDPDAHDSSNKRPLDAVRRDEDKQKFESILTGGKAADAGNTIDTVAPVLSLPEPKTPVANLLTENEEAGLLRRLNEEKDMIIVALRETVETLLEKDGVLKYISKLQEEYRTVSAQMQRIEDHREHLQSMYSKCDSELESVMKENAELRNALHEKEQRLLNLLDEADHPRKVQTNYNSSKIDSAAEFEKENATYKLSPQDESKGDTSELKRQRASSDEKRESIDLILIERSRLAQELESERRLRFSEARLHLSYTSQLRDQLREAQAKVKALMLEQQKTILVENLQQATTDLGNVVKSYSEKPPHPSNDHTGFWSSLYSSLFGAEDEDSGLDDSEDEDFEEIESPTSPQ